MYHAQLDQFWLYHVQYNWPINGVTSTGWVVCSTAHSLVQWKFSSQIGGIHYLANQTSVSHCICLKSPPPQSNPLMLFLIWCGDVMPPLEPNQSIPLLVCHTLIRPFLYLVILLDFALCLSLRLLLLQLRLIILYLTVRNFCMKLPRTTSKMDVCFKMTTAVVRLSTEGVGDAHVLEPPGGLGLCIFIILIIFSASSWIF